MRAKLSNEIEDYIAAKIKTLFAENAIPIATNEVAQVILTADQVTNLMCDFKKVVMNTIENSAFGYYVMLDHGGKPTRCHPTYRAAMDEASRLVAKEHSPATILIEYDNALPF